MGDLHNNAGNSLFVHLRGKNAGRWQDAATGERGDLLDLIKHARGHAKLGHAMAEARQILGIVDPPRNTGPAALSRGSTPTPAPAPPYPPVANGQDEDVSSNTANARRLWERCKPLHDTDGAIYLHSRGISDIAHESLRFHPEALYREDSFVTRNLSITHILMFTREVLARRATLVVSRQCRANRPVTSQPQKDIRSYNNLTIGHYPACPSNPRSNRRLSSAGGAASPPSTSTAISGGSISSLSAISPPRACLEAAVAKPSLSFANYA